MEMPISEEMFEAITAYFQKANCLPINIKRAQMIGIDRQETEVAPGANVRIPKDQIGEDVFIGLFCYLNGNVTIEDHVMIGPHCSIVAGNHKFDPKTGWFSGRTEHDGDDSVVLGYGSWLASNVTVTPGVKLGRANLVCAGAVVTKSTPDYAIMAGVPAKQIGRIDPETGEYIWFSREKRE